jgi:hypothetical protein
MFRRLLFVAVATTVALSACSAAPAAAPALTDPKDILTKSVLSLKDVKTFHFKADVAGEIKMDLTGSGSPGALNLKDTTAEGDIDIAGKKIHAGFAAPALLGVTGDIIVIGNDTYTKISLLGPKYTKSTTSDAGDAAAAAGDPLKAIDEIQKFLNTPGVAPTKLADEKCGDKDCYHVQLTLTADQLGGITGSLASGAPAPTGTVDVWVQKTDLHPAKFSVAGSAGDQGNLTVTMTLTNYDAAVTVNPPADADIEVASPAAS